MYGQYLATTTATSAVSLPLLYTTAYRLWWVVLTLTLIAAAAALYRLIPRKMQ
jgi:hypothetical protein